MAYCKLRTGLRTSSAQLVMLHFSSWRIDRLGKDAVKMLRDDARKVTMLRCSSWRAGRQVAAYLHKTDCLESCR